MYFLPFSDSEGLAAMPAPPTGNSFAPRQIGRVAPKLIAEQPQQEAVSCPAFDAEAALGRVDGKRELLRPMAGVFALQWRNLCDEIASASRRSDGAALEMAAHKLDGSVRSFGAGAASRVAQELEACARTGDFHDLEKTCIRLNMEVERLVNSLKGFASERVP